MNFSPHPTLPPGLPVCQGKNHRCSTNAHASQATVDLALDAIGASDLERRVAHLVCRVNSPRSALRVVAGFRGEIENCNHPTANGGENKQFPLRAQANSSQQPENEK